MQEKVGRLWEMALGPDRLGLQGPMVQLKHHHLAIILVYLHITREMG